MNHLVNSRVLSFSRRRFRFSDRLNRDTIAHKLAGCPVDFRLLVVGLLLNASVPLFFSLLWGLVRSLAVGQNLTSLLDISIVAMIAVLSFGLFLVGYGLVRGGVVKDWQAGILFLGSLALGVLTFNSMFQWVSLMAMT